MHFKREKLREENFHTFSGLLAILMSKVTFSKDLKRGTYSYTKSPQCFPILKCSNHDPISKENLNKTYVSVPHGSEHQSYTQIRKNMYEEALFKVEDERFEFDININLIKQALKFISLETSNKNPNLEQSRKNVLKISKLRIV